MFADHKRKRKDGSIRVGKDSYCRACRRDYIRVYMAERRADVDKPEKIKLCSRCGNPRGQDRKDRYCRECRRDYKREYKLKLCTDCAFCLYFDEEKCERSSCILEDDKEDDVFKRYI